MNRVASHHPSIPDIHSDIFGFKLRLSVLYHITVTKCVECVVK